MYNQHLWNNYAFRKRLLSCWEMQDIDCFVVSQHRWIRHFCFHLHLRAAEIPCDVIRKLLGFFLYKGEEFVMKTWKENKLYFTLWGIFYFVISAPKCRNPHWQSDRNCKSTNAETHTIPSNIQNKAEKNDLFMGLKLKICKM